jgi:hypothetical protein
MCGIAFIQYLESENWEAHTELEDLSDSPSLESSLSIYPDPEIAFEARLKALQDDRKALILRNSHVGGHKFAGNVIVSVLVSHFPSSVVMLNVHFSPDIYP